MNIWGEDGNGFTVEIHSYVTMLSAHVYLSLNPPLFSAARTVLATKLSFEWLLAFIPNLSPKANTGEEPVHPQNMEFAQQRCLRCLCILAQALPLAWRN